jgi:acyl carrier protein
MNQPDLETLIIEHLARYMGVLAGDLRRDLEERGQHLPIDSVLAAAVLADVEAACGVSLPATAERAESLRSVTAFAAAILDLLQDDEAEATGTSA